jgi:hypothetical protein
MKSVLTVSTLFGRFLLALRGSNSVVECHLAKVDVEGSNPFSRSTNLPNLAGF